MRFSLSAPLIVATLLLTSCGSSGTTPSASCVSTYWDGTIGTCLPAGWNALSHDEVIARGMPADVVIAFQAADALSGQFPTITVTRERLQQAMAPAAYSAASVALVARRSDYAKIDTKEVTIDSQKVILHVFSAQPLTGEPKQRFYQLASTSGETGYVFTAALPLSAPESVVSQVTLILTNVTFTAPAE